MGKYGWVCAEKPWMDAFTFCLCLSVVGLNSIKRVLYSAHATRKCLASAMLVMCCGIIH